MRYVYIMRNTRYFFRYKIGISNNVNFRRESIDRSMKGQVRVIFSAKFYYAENVEMMLHQIYRPLSAKMKGSGKTEWFWMIFPITPILLLLSIWVIQRFIAYIMPAALIFGGIEIWHQIKTDNAKNIRNSRIDRSPAKGIVSPTIRSTIGENRATTRTQRRDGARLEVKNETSAKR